jgi:hypothetical protein
MDLSRRRFLAGTAGVAGLVATGGGTRRLSTAAGPADCAAPVDFPLDRYQETYQNWAGALTVPGVWTCAPRTADEVVAVVNWAWQHGYAVRGRGHRHSWTPLTVTAGADCGGNVVLVDTTRHLTGLALAGGAVRAQAGASLDALLEFAGQPGTASPPRRRPVTCRSAGRSRSTRTAPRYRRPARRRYPARRTAR